MLEIERLHEITPDMLIKAVDDAVSNKIFVRNNIEQIPNLNKEDLLNRIHALFFSKSSVTLVKTINNIEWTPTKLYLTGYYVVNLHNTFWVVSHNTHEGFVVKYKITQPKYIDRIYQTAIKISTKQLPECYWCTKHEILNAIKQLKEAHSYILIKQMSFVKSSIVLNHYIYKQKNQLYYFQFSTECVYKPVPLGPS